MDQHKTIWRDGQAVVFWLSGVHPEVSWVNSKSYLKERIGDFQMNSTSMSSNTNLELNRTIREEAFSKNKVHYCNLSVTRLNNLLWFGLFEELDISMELFNIQIGRARENNLHDLHNSDSKQFTLPKLNKNKVTNYKKKKKLLTTLERSKIEKFMPLDMMIYDYAVELFRIRAGYLLNGTEFIWPEWPDCDRFGTVDER